MDPTTAAVNGYPTFLLSKLRAAHDSVQSSLTWNHEPFRPFVMCDGSNHGWLQSMRSIPTRALEEQLFDVAGDMAAFNTMCGSSMAYSVFVDEQKKRMKGNQRSMRRC